MLRIGDLFLKGLFCFNLFLPKLIFELFLLKSKFDFKLGVLLRLNFTNLGLLKLVKLLLLERLDLLMGVLSFLEMIFFFGKVLLKPSIYLFLLLILLLFCKGLNFELLSLIELFTDIEFILLLISLFNDDLFDIFFFVKLLRGVLALFGNILLDIKSPSILILLLLGSFFFVILLFDFVFFI